MFLKKGKILFMSVHLTQVFLFVSIILGVGLMAVLIGFSAGRDVNSRGSGQLAIVIDDFGLQRKGVSEMLELDCKLTLAIMPFLEHTEDDAEDALENGKEVIIHIPMQATTHDRVLSLGPRPIRINNSPEEIHNWIEDALIELPEAVGANIHMGTLCSTKEEIMRPVFEILEEKQLYFLDSRTSSKSVCRRIAREANINFYENQVFLEHESKNKEYVKKRLRKAMKIAREEGMCIAIGHVGNEGGVITAEAICELLPECRESGVELVFVSELMPFNQLSKQNA